MVLRVEPKLAFVRIAHHYDFSVSGDQSRVLMVEAFAATNLCHVFKFSRTLLLELVVAPTDGQVVMSQSKSIIVAALNLFDVLIFEYLLHVDLSRLGWVVPLA